MTNEFQLVEKRELREEFIGRMEVLDKVGDLILLPSTEFATTEQVATYYGVTTRHIEDIISNNKEELISDGYGIRKADDFITELNFGNKVTKQRGKFLVEFDENNVVTFAPRGISLFPKRAILRVGMLLRDSEVAKEIRSRLLDIVHDAEQGKTDIIQGIANDIDEEKVIKEKMFNGMLNGDVMLMAEAATLLSALKNKRIAELEAENQAIMTSKLDITESKSVINRILRKIAYDRYHGNFKAAYAEFYSSVNYKLHINVNNRNGKGLSRFSDDEIFEMEKIARSWAVRIGLDLDDLLKLA